MRRLKILVWHVHGSYLDALTSADHDWYLPVVTGPNGYGGRRRSSPPHVREIPAERVREEELDVVVYQTPRSERVSAARSGMETRLAQQNRSRLKRIANG